MEFTDPCGLRTLAICGFGKAWQDKAWQAKTESPPVLTGRTD